MICRICEEVVKSSELEKHSRICNIANRNDIRQMDSDLRLRKLAKAMSERRMDAEASTEDFDAISDFERMESIAMAGAALSSEGHGDAIEKCEELCRQTEKLIAQYVFI